MITKKEDRQTEINIILNIMRENPVDSIVTYENITKALSCEIELARALISKAKIQLETEGIFYRSVRYEGYLRLKSNEAAQVSRAYISQRNKTTIKNGKRKLAGLPKAELDKSELKEVFIATAQLGILETAMTLDAKKKLGKEIEKKKYIPLELREATTLLMNEY